MGTNGVPRQSSTSPYYRQRPGSTASSIHSFAGLPDTISGSWANAVLEAGQNAISTLLQPPIVRTGLLPHTSAPTLSDYKPPTTRDIPPVALTNITHVDVAEFKPYLTQVGALYERLQRLKEREDESADTLDSGSGKTGEFAAVFDEGHLQPGKRCLSSLSPMETSVAIRRFSSGFAKRETQAPPPLSTIPRVYFDKDFHLENPRIFDVVSDRSEVVRPPPGSLNEKAPKGNGTAPRKALATNAILQEKLSWYMDTIEMCLIASISTASAAFFTALGSLHELHSETAGSVERIKALRKELQALDNEIVMSGLNIIQKRQRQEHLQQLHDAVQQLKHIIDSLVACESLVDSGEVEKALKCIDSLEKLIAGEPDFSQAPLQIDGQDIQLRDLRAVTALQSVNDDLTTLRFRIGKASAARFLSLLMGDLGRHTDAVSTQEILMRWTSASARSQGGHTQEPSVVPSYMSSTDGLRSQLLEILASLHRAKHLTSAASAYREAVLKEIRNLVRRPLPTSNDDDNDSTLYSSNMARGQLAPQEKSSILTRNLRALQPEEAEELLIKIYISVTETLRRSTTQVKLLLDVASSLGDDTGPSGLRCTEMDSPPITPAAWRPSIAALEAQEIHKAIDLQSLLGEAVDVAQNKIVKLLRVRSEQSTHLSLIRFLRYFALNLYFNNECESISGQSGTALKTIINGQIQDFIQQHGDIEKQKLAQGMDSDQWEAKDFSEKHTTELDRILSCSTKDPAEWSDGIKPWILYSDDDPDFNCADDPQLNSDGKAKTRNASIHEEIFVLPSSAIICMNGVARFLQLIVGIPSMTSDIGASLVSYLQLFNSRCTQLILGAGARRSAGLKNITSKHLVLASQALAFVATLISYIREFVRRHAGTGAAASSLVEFDKAKRLYQEHQNSIYDKIVEIMTRLAASHVKTIKHIDWDNEQKNVHSYMATLTKDTTSLHRILTKSLPEATVGMIMTLVFISYRDQFGKAFQEVDPATESGRESMLHDIKFFESKLGKLDGSGDTAEYLTTIIKSMQVTTGRPANLADGQLEKKDTENTANSADTRDNTEDKDEEADKADDDEIAADAVSDPEAK
ncbi:vacuolar sorting protein [Metarhizium brunneum]